MGNGMNPTRGGVVWGTDEELGGTGFPPRLLPSQHLYFPLGWVSLAGADFCPLCWGTATTLGAVCLWQGRPFVGTIPQPHSPPPPGRAS